MNIAQGTFLFGAWNLARRQDAGKKLVRVITHPSFSVLNLSFLKFNFALLVLVLNISSNLKVNKADGHTDP